jgi:hypothetical protein
MLGFNGGLIGKPRTYTTLASNSGIWVPNERTISLGQPWNPSMISTALWLDAMDTPTLNLDLSLTPRTVYGWHDKSGNINNCTTVFGSLPTYNATGLNGKPTIDFNNSSAYLGIATRTGLSGTSDLFYAAVFQMRSGAGVWRMVMGPRGTGAGVSGFNAPANGTLLLQRMFNVAQIGGHNADVEDTRIKVDVTDMFVPRIATIGRTGGTAGNGGTVTVTATDPSQANYLTTGTQSWTSAAGWAFQIGGRQQSGTNWYDGTISECIALDRNATTLERQKIEGYLAHKWGLVASLPSDHPFKNYAPIVG